MNLSHKKNTNITKRILDKVARTATAEVLVIFFYQNWTRGEVAVHHFQDLHEHESLAIKTNKLCSTNSGSVIKILVHWLQTTTGQTDGRRDRRTDRRADRCSFNRSDGQIQNRDLGWREYISVFLCPSGMQHVTALWHLAVEAWRSWSRFLSPTTLVCLNLDRQATFMKPVQLSDGQQWVWSWSLLPSCWSPKFFLF